MKKIISILGSTGSIGLNSLKIIKKKKNLFKINILGANKNFRLICSQINEYKPDFFLVNDFKTFKKVEQKHRNVNTKIINEIKSKQYSFKKSDIAIAAIPGIAGLNPTIELIKNSKKILIANKESIICGWKILKKIALKKKTKIVPIDSEHFSIMKLLEKHDLKQVRKIYLTASGGPFLNLSFSKLKKVKPVQAIKHPKWKMGKKISIDSASLMNKILELIEAQKLFSIPLNKLEVIIHPESLVHAIIELKNGLFKFIYHDTSMIIPLANAIFDDQLNIEEFFPGASSLKKNKIIQSLNFSKVDVKKFPIFKLKTRLVEHNSTPIIINAANEVLVDQYLKKKIPFVSFYKLILNVLNDRNYKKYAIKDPINITQILKIDQWARNTIFKKINKNA